MKTMTRRCLALLACVLAFCAATHAQQEQWLGYRTSDQAEVTVGGTPGQAMELSAEKPAGVKLPAFTSASPLLAKWKTPMLPAGFLWVALDASKGGQYDRLYIDANGDGSLADETPVSAADPRMYRELQSADFRQVKVSLPGADGPTAYHLNFTMYISGPDSRRMVAKAAGWYEGTVRVGDKKHPCALFDANADGAFDEASDDLQAADRIKMGGSGFAVGRVGKYIMVDDRLCRLVVAKDGSSVTFSPPQDVAMGTVKVTGGIQHFSASGVNGLLAVRVQDGVVKLPLGKYQVSHWDIQRQDSAGMTWELQAAAGATPIRFEVTADKPAALDLGEPVISVMTMGSAGKGVYQLSDPRLAGRLGERVLLIRGGQPAPPPQVAITNADGTYQQRFGFEFG